MSLEVRVPMLGESIVEAVINRWLKREGDHVIAGEPLLELETDKVNVEVPAEQSGVVIAIRSGEGNTVRIGDVLCIIGDANEMDSPPEQPTSPPTPQHVAHKTHDLAAPIQQPVAESTVPITPVAQRMATEHAVNVTHIMGSGQGGRVTKHDVETVLQQQQPSPQPPTPMPTPSTPTSPAVMVLNDTVARGMAPVRPEERQRMSRRRQTIAHRLLEAQHNAAMLTTFNEIDMSAVMSLRTQRKAAFHERHGVGLGFMSFFVKATIGALHAFPLLNAEIQGDEIVIKHYYDIGVAVGTPQGLVVPVLRDANTKTFAQIEQGIADMARRARTNELSLDEVQGGTFSITNGGIYGSLLSTPILNTPQVGILGMHNIEERPVAIKGEVVIRPMMYVALSYDHRIVDGSDAVQCLVHIKKLVEDPVTLLLEG